MPEKGMYIQLFSLHGLIRGTDPELGRDADTGGQVKYVLELARALGEHPEVAQVDLVSRLIVDRRVSPDYGRTIEPLSDKVRIVRLQCGGRKYMRKELLWPHLEEFIEHGLQFIKRQKRVPDFFHGHYADAGYVAMGLAEVFDASCVFTGHSMGRNKLEKLLADGLGIERIQRQYRIDTRIDVEEEIIARSDLIICSTGQEIDKQYGLYRQTSRRPQVVIPPGIDLDVFYPHYRHQVDPGLIDEASRQARKAILRELHRFWAKPGKPFILALCRPDHRKNICGLIAAYGMDKDLQALANLAIFAGIRSDIKGMEENEQEVLTEMLFSMDRFDLYGKLAIPKKHNFATEVPELYRICADSRGVFVNPALVEPFGLTLIEASACGLPIVATRDGGPAEIVANCDNGVLVDAANPGEIAQALRKILVDEQMWDRCSNNGINGVRRHYSWASHVSQYVDQLRILAPSRPAQVQATAIPPRPSFGRRLTSLNRLMIADIDNTLLGDQNALERLLEMLERYSDQLAWGVATGRSLELTLEAMTEHHIPIPDILVCSVGTEIYYGPQLRLDKGWRQHISYKWEPERVQACMAELDFLALQEPERQRRYKISYYLDKPRLIDQVHAALANARLACQVVYSHGQYLDLLPLRASKGKAIGFIRHKYGFSSDQVMVAGDSGNDEDMVRGAGLGLVVGNHSSELTHLRGRSRIFFSPYPHAAGIIDGLRYYGLLPPEEPATAIVAAVTENLCNSQ
ncbi:MAG: HAD-IIB family hydrolase [Thermodesulfobacteriota bacterium]